MSQPIETSESVQICLGLPARYRVDAARLFYEAFRDQLRTMMPTEEVAVDLLPSDLDPNRVIVAIVDDKLAGFAGLAYEGHNYMTFKYRDFTARFGSVGGFLRYLFYSAGSRPRLTRDLVVDGLGVTESMRRRGIGRKLVDAVCDYAKSNGFHAVRLEVADTNEEARRLYERAGFSVVRTRKLPGFVTAQTGYRADIEMCKPIT